MFVLEYSKKIYLFLHYTSRYQDQSQDETCVALEMNRDQQKKLGTTNFQSKRSKYVMLLSNLWFALIAGSGDKFKKWTGLATGLVIGE